MTTLAAGLIIGREFRIVRPLRAGGMGEVYVAEQLSTGKLRALKVLSAQVVGDNLARERFVREARVGSLIESDHVVEVVTAGVDEPTGNAFLVMELLRGEDIDEIVEQLGRIPLADVVEILSQVGHALERAHALGIVHRDIKPANIFLAAPRRRGAPFTVKLLDFGIAKAVQDSRLTGGQPLGTPLYMAPEQMERAASVTPSSDVWALGLVAFRLLTGFEFWRCADRDLPSLVKEVVVDPIPAATQRAKELTALKQLPAGFDHWFARCVDRDPLRRFTEGGEAARAFAELAHGELPPGTLAEWLRGVGASASSSAGSVDVPALASSPGASSESSSQPLTLPHDRTIAAQQITAAPGAVPGSSRVSLVAGGAALVVAVAFFAVRGASGPSHPAAAALAPTPPAAAPAPSPTPTPSCPADMILISGGVMFMGDLGIENAQPPHKVKVRSYCLDKTEVTASAYDACAKGGNCLRAPQTVSFPGMTPEQATAFAELCTSTKPDRANHPINCVDWHMADNFCRSSGGRLSTGGARLPTEAEWEYAARGSVQRIYPWGDTPPDPTRLNACGSECVDWFENHKMHTRSMYEANDGFAGTAPVGSFPAGASEAGVLDLAGNVWEWTGDWYEPYTRDERTDPKGADSGTERVVRGGSFNGAMTNWARPAYRWQTTPDAYNHAIGFRCAKDVG